MSENHPLGSDEPALNHLAKAFEKAAHKLYMPDCPLYSILSSSVALDRELLALAAHTRQGQAPTILLFYVVHYLLLRGEKHPLAKFYASLTDNPAPPDDATTVFADFCREHREEIRGLLTTRLVQTNEVLRSALLLPAIVLAAEKAGGAPLARVGLGARAGLNLFFDRHGYDYGNGLRCGDLSSLLQLSCKLRGSFCPPIPTVMPKKTRGQFLTLYCFNSFINFDSLLAPLSISACILDTLDGDTPNIPATAFRLRFTTLRNR